MTNLNIRVNWKALQVAGIDKTTAVDDVRLTDVDTAKLRDVALELKRGGVGYYKASDFVHIDNGRVRRW